MVPASVQNAYKALPENRKAAITRAIAKKQPLLFQRWAEAAGLKSFRKETLIGRKANAGQRFDQVLFTAEDDQLAMDVLVAYFTELSPEINDRYLELLDAAGNEEAETQLQIYGQLANQFSDSPYLDLYLHTALWAEEFAEDDIEVVRKLAAGEPLEKS